MERRPASPTLWDRLQGRYRILVTNLLLVAVLATALAALGTAIIAIRESGDTSYFPEDPGDGGMRLLNLSTLMRYWSFQLGARFPVVSIAALGVFALTGHDSARQLPLRWRRGVFGTALAAVGIAGLVALFELFLALYALTSVEQDVRESYFGLSAWMIAGGMVLPGVEVVLGIAVVIVALAWWPARAGAPGLLDDEIDPDLESVPTSAAPPYAPPEPTADAPPPDGPPADQPGLTRPDLEESAPVVRPRLRPDGSSDSGYDPFRFRG